jgi:ribonucleoside-diphosphate reductase alpha chain
LPVEVKTGRNKSASGTGQAAPAKLGIALKLSDNSLRVLRARYLKKNEAAEVVETPEQMFWRVAWNIASTDLIHDSEADVEKIASEFYSAMARLEFLPNSPTLMNAGNALQQLSACFVLPIDDSIASIGKAITDTMLIHKSGGGTGFAFSRLRPKGDIVASSGGVASGPISFMRIFDTATEQVKQGGTRRGANMGILRVDHPDVLDFIRCKRGNNGLSNFNISVGLTEEFMDKVENGEDFPLLNPRTREPRIDPQTGAPVRLKAREVFDLLVESAWEGGDPGIVFLDRVNRDNPTPSLGEIESTNPCGEQPLLPYESCNLGSINLSQCVKNGAVNWQKLGRLVKMAVHFLDNVVDANKYPLPEIEKNTRYGNRKIGLGIMGWADMLIRLGIPYDSEEALRLAEDMMQFIWEKAWDASIDLTRQRGPFPNFAVSVFAVSSDGTPTGKIHRPGRPRRNATVSTIAPTGTLSIIAGCSSGIEPLFAVVYERHVMDKEVLLEINPLFKEMAVKEGFYSDELMAKIAKKGTVKDIPEVPRKIQRLFVTAHDINPTWHVRMQAAFQKFTDNAVSKTVNFPESATKEDVAEVYWQAYRLNCKGVTVYRDQSKAGQVLTLGAAEPTPDEEGRLHWRRPELLHGSTYKIPTGFGESLYVTINEDQNGNVREVFANISRVGSDLAADAEGHGILASTFLQSVPKPDPQVLVRRLAGIAGSSLPSPAQELAARSIPDGIALALRKHLERKQKGDLDYLTRRKDLRVPGRCPFCRSPNLRHQEGCLVCLDCNYSECV